MDIDRLHEIEKGFSEQAEAAHTTFHNLEAVKNVATLSLAPAPFVTTILSVLHTSMITPGIPNNFNGDQVHG
jgi:hypothetical protein